MQMKAKCLLIILFFSIFIYSCNSSNVEGEKATKTIDLTGVLFSDEPQLLSLFVDRIEYVR